MKKLAILLMIFAPLFASASTKVGWSRYTGWEPYAVITEFGIMDKWNATMGTDIEIVYYGDYLTSLDDYSNGQIAGVAATNFDIMVGPATTGIVSRALYTGDISNGNDAVITRNGDTCAALKGQEIILVEGSVSHLLLAVCLSNAGLSFDDVDLRNVSDADIATIYLESEDVSAVTWNPPLQQVLNDIDTTNVFDSSQTNGLIADSLWINDKMFTVNERKAITGAWFEVMAMLSTRGKQQAEIIEYMTSNSATPSVAQFRNQMSTTGFFYNQQAATVYHESNELKIAMRTVRTVLFAEKLYMPGTNVSKANTVGVQFPDGSVQGDSNYVRMIFDTTYTK